MALLKLFGDLWRSAYEVIVVVPAYRVFREGPSVVGGWKSQSDDAICAALTTVPGAHWRASAANSQECSAVVQNEFASFLVIVDTVAYGFALYYAAKAARCAVTAAWGGGRRQEKRHLYIVAPNRAGGVPLVSDDA